MYSHISRFHCDLAPCPNKKLQKALLFSFLTSQCLLLRWWLLGRHTNCTTNEPLPFQALFDACLLISWQMLPCTQRKSFWCNKVCIVAMCFSCCTKFNTRRLGNISFACLAQVRRVCSMHNCNCAFVNCKWPQQLCAWSAFLPLLHLRYKNLPPGICYSWGFLKKLDWSETPLQWQRICIKLGGINCHDVLQSSEHSWNTICIHSPLTKFCMQAYHTRGPSLTDISRQRVGLNRGAVLLVVLLTEVKTDRRIWCLVRTGIILGLPLLYFVIVTAVCQ